MKGKNENWIKAKNQKKFKTEKQKKKRFFVELLIVVWHDKCLTAGKVKQGS